MKEHPPPLTYKSAGTVLSDNVIGADIADQRFRAAFGHQYDRFAIDLRFLLIADVVEAAVRTGDTITFTWDRVIEGVTLKNGRNLHADGADVREIDLLLSYARTLSVGAGK